MKKFSETRRSSERYFKLVREGLTRNIPAGPNKILEVGCAEGAAAQLFREQSRASFIVGLEMNEDAAEIAGSCLDRVICGDVEALETTSFYYCPVAGIRRLGGILGSKLFWSTVKFLVRTGLFGSALRVRDQVHG